jgi:hypothetical protein
VPPLLEQKINRQCAAVQARQPIRNSMCVFIMIVADRATHRMHRDLHSVTEFEFLREYGG